MSEPRRGWRTRGRLPHADFAGLTQAVTFRLADAMPGSVLERMQRDIAATCPDPQDARRAALLREHVHTWLDAGHGSCLLRDPLLADLLAEEMIREDGVAYRLEAFVIMPNHVHVVLKVGGRPLGGIVRGWKGVSARWINQTVGRSGPLWCREYFDRFIRDEEHAIAAIRYVVRNPVQAGLVERGGDWHGLWVDERWEAYLAAG